MTKHAANTMEAVPRFKAGESARSNDGDESACALDDDFEQMSKCYTPKNTEARIS